MRWCAGLRSKATPEALAMVFKAATKVCKTSFSASGKRRPLPCSKSMYCPRPGLPNNLGGRMCIVETRLTNSSRYVIPQLVRALLLLRPSQSASHSHKRRINHGGQVMLTTAASGAKGNPGTGRATTARHNHCGAPQTSPTVPNTGTREKAAPPVACTNSVLLQCHP